MVENAAARVPARSGAWEAVDQSEDKLAAVPKRPSLLNAFGWISIGTLSYTGAQFVYVVLIARILGAEAVGEYGLAQAVSAPIFMLAHMQLRRLAATDVRNEFPLSAYLLVQVISGAVGVGLVVSLGAIAYPEILGLLLGVALFKWTEALSFIAFGVMQRRGEMKTLGVSMVFRGITTIPVVAVALLTTRSVTVAVFASVALAATFLLAYDLPNLRRRGEGPLGRSGLDRAGLTRLLRLGLPAGGRTGLTSLTTVLPRYVLEYFAGMRAVGLFMALFQLIQLCAAANQSVINAILSRMSQHYHDGPRQFISFLGKVLLAASGAATVMVLLGYFFRNPIISSIYGSDFSALAPLLPLFLAVAGLRLLLGAFTAASVSMRLLTQELFLMIPTLASAALLSLILIPRFGIAGAGWALLGSTLVNVLCLAILVGRNVMRKLRESETLSDAKPAN